MTQPRELTLQAADSTSLHVVDWLAGPAETMRDGIVVMHGLGEHCGRYHQLAQTLCHWGWSTRIYDHRGHGRSGGPRGDVPDDEAMLRDAKIVIDDFAKQLAAPPVLLGHSMGGLLAARFAAGAISLLRGVILSSPALALRLPGARKLAAAILHRVAPGLRVPHGLPVRYLSHDPEVIRLYRRDPLVHSKISARLLHSMLFAAEFAQSHAHCISIPTLLLVAGDDRLVDASGSERFLARLAPEFATVRWYPDFYHELLNESSPRRMQVFDDMHDWLSRLAGDTANGLPATPQGNLLRAS